MAQPSAATGRKQRSGRSPLRSLLVWFLILLVATGLTACNRPVQRLDAPLAPRDYPQAHGTLTEVAPPLVLNELRASLDRRRPQVKILSPKPTETLASTSVDVRLEVQDLPLFLNPDLGLGPHVHLLLDNQPYQAIYDVSKPIQLTDLSPGTHTLRAFVVRPWHESFKNEGAYAQVSFNVITPSPDNQPAPKAPLLTYSRPKGSYGAEPILLDFYLTNAPLHALASSDVDESPDWRIRVTVNGESFLLDDWESVWLEGFQPGQNWVKTELLDGKGDPVETPFNTTVRLVEYQPAGEDTLSKLVRGELTASAAFGIVDPNYQPPAEPESSRSEDEREITKDEAGTPELAPVAIPERSLSSPTPKVDAGQEPLKFRAGRTKDYRPQVLPDNLTGDEASPEVNRSPAPEPPAVPSSSSDEQPTATPEKPGGESLPHDRAKQGREGAGNLLQHSGSGSQSQGRGQKLQRQFSTFLQRFRRQTPAAPEQESPPRQAPLEVIPSE